jgi:hypothetical protein
MSLNWNLSKIANKDTVCYTNYENGCYEIEKRLSGLTHSLIWATMAVDLGSITAKNIGEWQIRLQIISVAYSDPVWAAITRKQLEAHIGLSTNVSNTTRAKFMRKISQGMEREATANVRYSTQESAAA